jgi:HK97 gp10 family phage protein
MAKDSFKISLKVSGLQNLLNSLGGKKKALLDGMKQGVNFGAAIVEAKAKQIVPVRTGNLMRSIFTKFEDDGFKALIGPDILAAPYGYYVEFGRSKSGNQPPYPFAGRHYMEGAFYQTKGQVKSVFQREISKAIS